MLKTSKGEEGGERSVLGGVFLMTTWLIGRKNSKKIVKVPLQCLLLNQLIAYRKLSDPPLLGHQIHKFTFSILGLQTLLTPCF